MMPIWRMDDDQLIRFVLEKVMLREDLPRMGPREFLMQPVAKAAQPAHFDVELFGARGLAVDEKQPLTTRKEPAGVTMVALINA